MPQTQPELKRLYSTDEARARSLAIELPRRGWLRVAPGDIAKLRKTDNYDDWELATFHTHLMRTASGAVSGVAPELWRRHKVRGAYYDTARVGLIDDEVRA